MCRDESVYWFRQAFILVTINLQCLSNGVMLAFPSVLNPALLNPDSDDIHATPSQASWLASTLGLAGLLGFLIMSPIMQVYGRKPVHIIKNCVMAISWALYYYSDSLPLLFVARFVQGISFGGIFINMIMIGEFVHPCRRGYFTTIQKIALSSGTLICHVMSIWFSWRQIAATSIFMSLAAMCLTFFWTESPFFLAMRGRFDDCERSFHWLNGTSQRNAELEDLIDNQKKRRDLKKLEKGNTARKIFRQMISRDFGKSFLIVSTCIIAMDLSGRNYFKAYVIQIMMKLIGNKSTAVYVTVGSDSLVLIALLISCFVVKYFGRRILLFSFGSATVIVLFIISCLIYLSSKNIVYIWPWLTPSLVLFVNFIVHIGVSPVCFIIMGEVYPLELKGLGCCLSGMVFTSSYGMVLKLTPVLMENIGLGGTYIVYGSGLAICLVILYFTVPETKDKRLLDIEMNMKGDRNEDSAQVLLRPVV